MSTAPPFFTIGVVSTGKTLSPPLPAVSSSVLTNEHRLLLVVAGYFLLRAVVRTLVSNTPEWDEAEQLIQTQTWSWGYGPQPPLCSSSSARTIGRFVGTVTTSRS